MDSSVRCYDFTQLSTLEWTLQERIPKIKAQENKDKIDQSSINVLTPLSEKYTANYGKDFRYLF